MWTKITGLVSGAQKPSLEFHSLCAPQHHTKVMKIGRKGNSCANINPAASWILMFNGTLLYKGYLFHLSAADSFDTVSSPVDLAISSTD